MTKRITSQIILLLLSLEIIIGIIGGCSAKDMANSERYDETKLLEYIVSSPLQKVCGVNIRSSINSEVRVSKNLVVKGSLVEIEVSEVQNYRYLGVYTDKGKLISEDFIFTYIVEDDVNLVATFETISDDSTILYATEGLNARALPNAGSEVLFTLNDCQSIEAIGYDKASEWTRVTRNGVAAYCKTKYLSETKPVQKRLSEVQVSSTKFYGTGYTQFTAAGRNLDANLLSYLYTKLAEKGVAYFYPYAVAQAIQESGFNPRSENKNGLDKGLYQFRITYWNNSWGSIFDPYAQINIYTQRVANRLNSGLSIEATISRHMTSDYCTTINQTYVNHVLSRLSELR